MPDGRGHYVSKMCAEWMYFLQAASVQGQCTAQAPLKATSMCTTPTRAQYTRAPRVEAPILSGATSPSGLLSLLSLELLTRTVSLLCLKYLMINHVEEGWGGGRTGMREGHIFGNPLCHDQLRQQS
jgi:hypothetical protein